ncbi:MAG: hypothetical protein KJZ54_15750 [Phycisphaerales bacterium]|nr:hypothetical protein [Phycisphaerales bacterium]
MVPHNAVEADGYDGRGNLVAATAGRDVNEDGELDGTNDTIIAQCVYEYDARSALVREWQSWGGEADLDEETGSPRVEYGWEYESAGGEVGGSPGPGENVHRLSWMLYPARVQTGTRVEVGLAYGDDPDGVDNALSRVRRVQQAADSAVERFVQFGYAGSDRRVGVSAWAKPGGGGSGLEEAFRQTFGGGQSPGYAGLDRFGRVKDLHWTLSDGETTVQRFGYGRNSAGELLYARVEQEGEENTRSWLYGHDGLSRLRSAERGALEAGNDAIDRTTQGAPTPRRVSWGLDRLGNWTEGAGRQEQGEFVYAGRVEESDADLDGEYEEGELVEARAHSADLRNRLEGVETDRGGGPAAEGYVYDLAGNLVADDLYWYQYDAFNRLACVRLKGTLEFDGDGVVTDGEPGAWRAHFAYDALGRLVSKQVPWGSLGNDERWCWYYYDGVRRIVEVFRDPLVTGGGIGGGPPSGGSYTTYTDREYVWGPDYVDECLWQVDKVGDVAFVLQDGNYNVVGLVDEEGALLRQYAWDPYGQPIAVDDLGTFGHNRLGHQGLFFDRLDANAPNADLTATARGVYYARNRPYGPHIGRWMTSDPNGTGMSVLMRMDTLGSTDIDEIYGFDAEALFKDGSNLYGYLGSSPLVRHDPTGLAWDPFEAIDEIIFEHQLSGAVAFAKISSAISDREMLQRIRAYERGGFDMMDLIMDRDSAILFSMVAGPFFSTICFEAGTPVVLPDGSVQSIETLALGDVVFSRPDPHAPPLVAVGANTSDPDAHERIDPVTWRTVELTLEDAQRGTVRVSLLRPLEWFQATGLRAGSELALRLPEMGINGTARVVAIGPCPEAQQSAPGGQAVTGMFVTERAEIVRVWLEGATEPIGATPSHPFYSEDRSGWVAACELREGESVRTIACSVKVERIESVAEPTTVYNFEVHRSHTYYVGDEQVWVHNPCRHGQFVKGLRARGFGAPGPTRSGGGKMYTHPDGTRVRIMPRPNRGRFQDEPIEKFLEAYYYRVSAPNGGKWGPHIPLRGD